MHYPKSRVKERKGTSNTIITLPKRNAHLQRYQSGGLDATGDYMHSLILRAACQGIRNITK